jgi:hypothetical protein
MTQDRDLYISHSDMLSCLGTPHWLYTLVDSWALGPKSLANKSMLEYSQERDTESWAHKVKAHKDSHSVAVERVALEKQ